MHPNEPNLVRSRAFAYRGGTKARADRVCQDEVTVILT